MLNNLDADVIVIGGGHAGCEAAYASARLGCRTVLITMDLDRIGHMPCNCSIGGPAKGHLAREVDALGGLMGIVTDHALTHIRFVGTGKGPAVQTLRAHADKSLYPVEMRRRLEMTEGLELVRGTVDRLLTEDSNGTRSGGRVIGVITSDGQVRRAGAVVITTGTFLNGLMHCGHQKTVGGRYGEAAAVGLSGELMRLGIKLGRFKTGTTTRIDKASLDFKEVEAIPSDLECPPFSFLHEGMSLPLGWEHRSGERPMLLSCWQTHTNEITHRIIRQNLHRSAMYGGQISGIGPRYCPSIEDKIVRFADKASHPVFLEQEEWDSPSIYVQGMSTSLPADVQIEFLRTLPGLASVRMIRPGYAVEYDMVYPDQLDRSLKVRGVEGLYLDGQINGTSGYEEAAAQGWVAGVNAACFVLGRKSVILDRGSGYAGVMIDDLVTKGVQDPYRMLTSRAEYRLLLRHDNADLRLTPIGRRVGVVDDERWERFEVKRSAIDAELKRLAGIGITPRDNERLKALGTESVNTKVSLLEILRRPQINYDWIAQFSPAPVPISKEVARQVEIQVKYEGYIARQQAQVSQASKLEGLELPVNLDYHRMNALSMEGRDKLSKVRPVSIGQASRIPGVTPADIQILIVTVEQRKWPLQAAPS